MSFINEGDKGRILAGMHYTEMNEASVQPGLNQEGNVTYARVALSCRVSNA